jgi:DNA polymerase III epsilon subunit-like protein
MLKDRVLVGHNEAFDHRMLSREFGRLESLSDAEIERLSLRGQDFHRFPPTAARICTQTLYKRLRGRDVKTKGGSVTAMKYETTLAAALSYMGIVNENAHDAFADALATARLATALLNELGCWEEFGLSAPSPD